MEISISRKTDGFTLVELLVVIAIIALLAGILLPVLSRAKHSADAAVCRSNLQQQMIGLSLYTHDFEVYPRYMTPSASLIRRFWMYDIEGYAGSSWPEDNAIGAPSSPSRRQGVFACPSYNRVQGVYHNNAIVSRGNSQTWPLGAYAYNAYGGALGVSGYGLGGEVVQVPMEKPEDIRPIQENEVLSPSRMIALGDSVVSQTPYPTVPGQIHGEMVFPRFSHQLFLRELGLGGPLPPGAGLQPSSKAMQKRHAGRWTMAYVDGHVEHRKWQDYFDHRKESVLARWNKDNQPHREWVSALQQ